MRPLSKEHRSKGTRTFFLWLFLGALFFSLVVHLFFFTKAKSWKIQGFSAATYDTIIPRTFKMKRVDIDPSLLEEVRPVVEKKRTPSPVALDKEKPVVGDKSLGVSSSSLLGKPKDAQVDQMLQEEERVVTGMQSIMEQPKTAIENNITLPEGTKGALGKSADEKKMITSSTDKIDAEREKTGGTSREEPKFSNLDELLAGTTSLTSQTAPILMPTDLLFEYDSDQLKEAAEESLTKLGALIEKNAQATFTIEGHTDSYGSEEYNTKLSLRRAEAVKRWIQRRLGIEEGRIRTAGLGKSKLLIPASSSVQEQQLNRRVEIVIETK